MVAASRRVPRKRPIRVSAIVATYNRSGYLRECLDSLLAQTRPPIEVILVDDGSEDDTAQVAAAYGSRIIYLRQPNLGKSAALNRGIAAAHGSHLWFFDDDDVALPESLAVRLRVLESAPAAGYAYGGCLIGVDGADRRIEPVQRLDMPVLDPAQIPLRLLRSFLFYLQSVVVRRECVERAGGFDARYLRVQDYEFLIRLSRVASGVLAPGPMFVLREHAGQRGPTRLTHAHDDRVATWYRFSRMLGEQLAATLRLDDFLEATDLGLPAEQRTAAARVNRIEVMAAKGWLGQVVTDIHALAAASPATGGALSVRAVAECVEAFSHENFRLSLRDAPDPILKSLQRQHRPDIVRSLAAAAAVALARPRHHWRVANQERAFLGRMAWRLMRSAGPAAIIRVLRARLTASPLSIRPRPLQLAPHERAAWRVILRGA
jgi:Glycosyl transferase family 2